MGLSLWARPKADWPESTCWRQAEIWHAPERSQCLACQAPGVGAGQSLLWCCSWSRCQGSRGQGKLELPGAGMVSSVLASQEAALGGGLGEKECSWPRGGGEVRSLGY